MTLLGITCQKDDGPFLVEWLAHHLAAGVDRFLVLSHDCSDGSDTLLRALAQDARIEHLPFIPKGNKAVQWRALKLASDHPAYASADWALFFDCDEFLCLQDATLPDLLTRFEAASGSFDALALPWRFFGTGGQVQRGSGLTPERFTQAAAEDLHFPLGHLFKTLHRPEAFQKLGVHRPRSKPSKPARWIGPDGAELPARFAGNDGAISLYGLPMGARQVWLNHYALRSREEFMVKRARGLPNHMDREIGMTYWAERNWNSVEETSISAMMNATRAVYAELMDLPGVAAAHEACLNWNRAAYAALQRDIEAVRLEFRLGLVNSIPPSAQEGAAFVARQISLLSKAAE